MFIAGRVKIRTHEVGLHFVDGEFQRLLGPGVHGFFDPTGKITVVRVSRRDPWITNSKLDQIVKSGVLEGVATVLDLKDNDRALVWIDGRFSRIVGPGLHALWTGEREIRTEVRDAREMRFTHDELEVILEWSGAEDFLNKVDVEEGHSGVYFKDGQFVEALTQGRYAFWRNIGKVKIHRVDLRESAIDVTGQEIMTLDKVTLRLNAIVTWQVVDAVKSLTVCAEPSQALYRAAQMALRSVIGSRRLDTFLTGKDDVTAEWEALLQARAAELGIRVVSVGVRDIILPGDMKQLMNKVTEAAKAAEANLIARREETAAIRNQANTAKLLEGNPILMRLRELEILERIAANSKLQLVLGEKGLADRVTNLL